MADERARPGYTRLLVWLPEEVKHFVEQEALDRSKPGARVYQHDVVRDALNFYREHHREERKPKETRKA